jgi:ribonuclease Y
MFSTIAILEGALGFAVGALVVFLVLWLRNRSIMLASRREAEQLLTSSRRDAEGILARAKISASEEATRIRRETEDTFTLQRTEQAERERRLAERESLLNSQLERVMKSERAMDAREDQLKRDNETLGAERKQLTELTRQRREQLQSVSGLSAIEARQQFLKEIEAETMGDASKLSRSILEEARLKAEEKARRILSIAIQRHASDHTAETTTATIALQDVELKGRIIGREGRNIRAFEAATGVTVLIDDTPNAVVLSSFDPVRRETAKEAMLRLIQDGRIHPTRIEEVVAKVSQEMEESIVRLGEEAVHRASVPPLHPEIVKLLGRLHFRRSYSQNILDHSVEVAQLMSLMAAELGIDEAAARRAGLLHDIGKALGHEVEGPHAVVGADFAKRHGENEKVVNAIASHHNDVEPIGPLGILVSAADAISASRPGARSESMATYIKRVEDLERIGASFPGVEKTYAVQAGRELRVFVQPDNATDEQAFALARNIAQKIESELQYPGQIKVTVIRETRCVEIAK